VPARALNVCQQVAAVKLAVAQKDDLAPGWNQRFGLCQQLPMLLLGKVAFLGLNHPPA